ncbi:MAG: DNA methylase [Lachnospiraceae bacterium]|nr:DNA methylase [Lachnospiraceae bacterium]
MGKDLKSKIYAAIDLKSFYASVECVSLGRDPLTTNLVVADRSRTDKTICLAVSPALKSFGVPGRPRLFEVIQIVNAVNQQRKGKAPERRFTGASDDLTTLLQNPGTELDYIVAPPHMKHYMDISARIYSIYLRYVAPEDIFAYSIDEVFIDLTGYLTTYGLTAHEMVMKMIREVLKETGITATAGIGTNLFLAKVAMDIVAKHADPDRDGVRIAALDEMSYRKQLWSHRPLTDFWRVGRGYARRLEANGMFTMGDIALRSEQEDSAGEKLLYKLFGVNAELLIDHAWGWEPTTLADVKAYRPEDRSLGQGQVLQRPYEYEEGRLIVREMTDLLALDLVDKGLVTDSVVLTVGYDVENLINPDRKNKVQGEVVKDFYGRMVPKHAHGTENLGSFSSSTRIITEGMMRLYTRVVNPDLLIRRVTINANHVISEEEAGKQGHLLGQEPTYEQMDLFTDYGEIERERAVKKKELEREKSLQKAVIELKRRFGKNAVLKGMNLEKGAMTIERNGQVGGHRA